MYPLQATRYSATAITAVCLLLGAINPTAQAQQYEAFGRYEVHYSTLYTNQLAPEVAQAFGIQRAGTQAMLNISVIDTDTGDSIAASVTASARNLTGQLREVNLRERREQESIYYIGQFRIHNEETLRFDIRIQPEGRSDGPFEFDFRQKFYTE